MQSETNFQFDFLRKCKIFLQQGQLSNHEQAEVFGILLAIYRKYDNQNIFTTNKLAVEANFQITPLLPIVIIFADNFLSAKYKDNFSEAETKLINEVIELAKAKTSVKSMEELCSDLDEKHIYEKHFLNKQEEQKVTDFTTPVSFADHSFTARLPQASLLRPMAQRAETGQTSFADILDGQRSVV